MSSVLEQLVNKPYEHGFRTDIESDTVPPGLDESVIRETLPYLLSSLTMAGLTTLGPP